MNPRIRYVGSYICSGGGCCFGKYRWWYCDGGGWYLSGGGYGGNGKRNCNWWRGDRRSREVNFRGRRSWWSVTTRRVFRSRTLFLRFA